MTTPVEKRFNALTDFCNKYWPESNGYKFLSDTTAEQLTADIEAMRPLGRTDKWLNALTEWITMVNTCEHRCPTDEYHLDWAAMEGSTKANYARF